MPRTNELGVTASEPATIYDVAKAAGVSPSTVSHVVNGTRNVSTAMRQRVEDAIARLGYRPNDAARMLREGRAKLVGVISPDSSNPFFSRLAYHLEMLAFETGARIVNCNSDYDAERETAYLDDLVRRRVDGIIIAPVLPNVETEQRLRATGLPVVVVDRVSEALALPTVAIDNAAGAALAAHHLYSLGHRAIGCVTTTPGQVESVDLRTRGFLDTLAGLGVTVPSTAMRFGAFKVAGGLEATGQLLAAEPGLTAVFCTNDAMAVGALRAAAEAGRAVPGSLSIMGFDDSLEALLCQPHLTTVEQPLPALAEAAMRLLRGDAAEPRVRLQARLIVRESTAPAASETSLPRRLPHVATKPKHRQLRIALAGADTAGRRQARLLHRTGGAVLAGVHDPAPLHAENLADEFATLRIDTLEDALARGDLDGLIVSGPVPSRAQAILSAARYGVGVLAAIPFAVSDAELRQIAAAGDHSIVQAELPRGFDPGLLELASQLRSGRIGALASLRIVCRGGPEAGLLEELDLVSLLSGEPVVEVAALPPRQSNPAVMALTLRLASGALASIELCREPPFGFEHRVEAFGSQGELTLESRPSHGVVFRGREDGSARPLPADPFADAGARQMQAFVRALNAHATESRLDGSAAPLADVLAIHRLAAAARQAVATGRTVQLDENDPAQRRALGAAD